MARSIDHVFARLQSQLSRAEVVLFTGAGFSLDAEDSSGELLPSTEALTKACWNLAFPAQAYPEGVRLGDAFYSAKTTDPKSLRRLVTRRLSVGPNPSESYRTWLSLPWHRVYTLNIDDLELAVQNRFSLPRRISAVSATSGKRNGETSEGNVLEVVHLNGAVWDDLDDMTFSAVDYGQRQAGVDKWYAQCVTDIVSRPVVYVGTELDESLLWHYLELRQTKGAKGLRELRPGSIVISPSLNAARRLMLKELNVDWMEMTAERAADEFCKRLDPKSIRQGFQMIKMRQEFEARSEYPQLVSDIATQPFDQPTEYLMGQEPEWCDLQSGRAILRECDNSIYTRAIDILRSESPEPPLVLTGTAGSGKSTSLMRLALRISGN